MISDSGGHERRRSAAKEQSRCSSSVPALPNTHGDRPWCRNLRLFLAAIQKKVRRDPSRSVFAQLSSKIVKSNVLREVGCVACGPTPPLTSPSPPLPQCYRRRPFWPASGATARPPHSKLEPHRQRPHGSPTTTPGPALTPVDAAPRGLPFHEDRYSTWGTRARYLRAGGAAAF